VADEESGPPDLERDVGLIREARLIGDRGVRPYGGEARRLEPQAADETLADLEQKVRQGLADGTLTPEDATYQRYLEIRRQLQGDGELPVWNFH
jgi:hypothetical protein